MTPFLSWPPVAEHGAQPDLRHKTGEGRLALRSFVTRQPNQIFHAREN